jgi:hypothetical protein
VRYSLPGNTVIDALHTTVSDSFRFKSEGISDLDFEGKRIILVPLTGAKITANRLRI